MYTYHPKIIIVTKKVMITVGEKNSNTQTKNPTNNLAFVEQLHMKLDLLETTDYRRKTT